MGKPTHTDSVTIYAQLRENYNDTHSDFLSQSKLGKALGVTTSMVSKIENGRVLPSNEIIDAYSKFFEVTPDYLTGVTISEELKNSTAYAALGLSDKTVDTLRLIVDNPTNPINLVALLNAILGNGELTVGFLQSVFNLIETNNKEKNENNYESFDLLKDIELSRIKNYFYNTVAPQIRKPLAKCRTIDKDVSVASDMDKFLIEETVTD